MRKSLLTTGVEVPLRVNAEYVHLLADFTSPDPEMEALSYISVEPAPKGGVYLVALNGYQLGVFFDAEGEASQPVLLRPTKGLVAACKKRWNERARFVTMRQGRVVVENDGELEHYIEPYTATAKCEFPEWQVMLDRAFGTATGSEPGQVVGYKAPDLAKFDFKSGREAQALRFVNGGPFDPVVVIHHAYPEFIGLVMPLRLREEEGRAVRPDWLQVDPEEASEGFEPVDQFLSSVGEEPAYIQ